MTKSNAEWEEILNNLTEIGNDKTEVSPRTGYLVAKNRISIQSALQAYLETKQGIINKYSNGTGEINIKDNPNEFIHAAEEINEIAAEKTNIEISVINVDKLGEKDVPLDFIMKLSFMINEE